MLPASLGDLDLVESTDLPAKTLVAPLSIIREIRVLLGPLPINMLVGTQDAVLLSSDLFDAYNVWDDQRTDVDPMLN
ncbi:MAG: hypothetical protein R3B90_13450 [Planctomycetaceae bacterium]